MSKEADDPLLKALEDEFAYDDEEEVVVEAQDTRLIEDLQRQIKDKDADYAMLRRERDSFENIIRQQMAMIEFMGQRFKAAGLGYHIKDDPPCLKNRDTEMEALEAEFDRDLRRHGL